MLAALRRSAVQQHHVRVLAADLIELVPDQAVIVEVEAAREGDLWPGGQQHFGLGSTLRGEKVATAIIAAVRARWLTIDPLRGCQCDPVWWAKCSAARSRKNSMVLRRSIKVMPSAVRRSSSTERISEPSCSR